VHKPNDATIALREGIFEYARKRLEYDPAPLDSPQPFEYLSEHAGPTVTEEGLGGLKSLKLFEDVLAPATISTDHPGYLSFIPCAPTEAAKLFDLVVSASAIYGGSWMEGAGAVYAENEVLTWLAKEAGLPETAGGVFVQGGTLGNLSALVAARHRASEALKAAGKPRPDSWKFICSAEAHSSLKAAAAVMDVEIIKAAVGDDGRLRGPEVQAALDSAGDGVFAIVATGGTTNFGIVDRLDEIGAIAKANNIWFHVDGAYGLAGMLAPISKPLFAGLELADSFIVDPHKWLFAPFDACALIYRDPEDGRKAHTQHGEYLDTLTESGDWNPSDYAYNLTRRPRGLPLWFSLATHGVKAYRDAVHHNVELARQIADEITRRPGFKLVRDPELSVVVFTRDGWTIDDYNEWSDRLLHDGIAFVVPSSHRGEPNTRFAIVNPETSFELLTQILDSMEKK
jgi:glutamate/tyrosine decarboxylase-like PLP-dependent enzyme